MYYKPSGKFSITAFLLLLATCITVLPLLGLAYAYAIWYMPFIYVSFLLTVAFGLAIGYVLDRIVIRFGKVRNNKIGIILGGFGSLAALYFSWAVWVDLVVNAGESYGSSRLGITVSNVKALQVIYLALNPRRLAELIRAINTVGTWSIFRIQVSGIFLMIIWLVEALVVIIIPILRINATAKKPFYEESNSWFKEKELTAFNFIEEKDKIIAALENKNYNSLHGLTKATNFEENHSVFTIYFSGNNDYYLTGKNRLAKIDDKGKISFDDDEFIEYISVNPDFGQRLLKM